MPDVLPPAGRRSPGARTLPGTAAAAAPIGRFALTARLRAALPPWASVEGGVRRRSGDDARAEAAPDEHSRRPLPGEAEVHARVIYLTGATNLRDEPFLVAAGVGLMIQRGNTYHRWVDRYPWHAIDIGMAASDADPYLAYLEQRTTERCLFAVSPDAYPDAVESQRRGLEYAPLIRSMGFPVAVVAQDGAERLSWPWDDFDCLFIGGMRTPNPRDEWKTSPAAEGLVRLAREHGKWVHMGRVNSGNGVGSRMERARAMGCNSADGTFLKYRRRHCATDGPDERDRRGASELGRWVEWLATNPTLPGFTSFETPEHPTHRSAVTGTPPPVPLPR